MRFALRSSFVMAAPPRKLCTAHDARRFSISFVPPLFTGSMWSHVVALLTQPGHSHRHPAAFNTASLLRR